MQAEALADLLADLIDRVERRHRVLEDHGDVVAAHVTHLLLAHVEQGMSTIQDLAAMDLSRRHGDKAHDGHGRHGLTRTGLANDAERLAAVERIAHAVYRVNDAVLGVEVHLEVVHLKQMLPLGNGLRFEIHVGGI